MILLSDFHHISNFELAIVAILALKLITNWSVKGKDKDKPANNWLWTSLFSGILLVNALAHFTHGISGEDFPAPFGHLLGTGLYQHLANVVWGFINMIIAYVLFSRGQIFKGDKRRDYAFFAGILIMGLFLSFVFSHK